MAKSNRKNVAGKATPKRDDSGKKAIADAQSILNNVDATIEAVASLLGAKAESGSGWRAVCPVCGTRRPTLTFRVGDKGKPIFNCHYGCDYESIVAELKVGGIDVGGNAHPMTPDEKSAWAKGAAERERERYVRAAEAATNAAAIWDGIENSPRKPDEHGYLLRKKVRSHGLRVEPGQGKNPDRLVIPVQNIEGEIISLQYITPDGTKRFMQDARTKGGMYIIGEPKGPFAISEGIATTLSIHEATGWCSIYALSKGNLLAVAQDVRKKYPDEKIVLCADRDPNGGGEEAAAAAASSIDGLLAIPPKEAGDKIDFNDLANAEGFGLAAVKKAIEEDFVQVMPPLRADRDSEEIGRLSKLNEFEYEREREDVAKRLGVRVSKLDKQVEKKRSEGEDTEKPWEQYEAWPHPVEGLALFDEIKEAISRHLSLPKGATDATALWVLHAHALDAATASPRLLINSPAPGCGKSTLLGLLTMLVPRPLPASNATAAAIFRAIDKWKPTLFLDEADTFLRDNEELRGVLNSGHARTGSVLRTVGDAHEPTVFKTWGALVTAGLGSLNATLVSRAISIRMQRAPRGANLERLRTDKGNPYAELNRKAARWAADRIEELRTVDPVMTDDFDNRRADNWRPLFAIADLLGAEVSGLARVTAGIIDTPSDGQALSVLLLSDLQRLFNLKNTDRMATADILAALHDIDSRPWSEWGKKQAPMSAPQLARQLKPYLIFPRTLRGADPDGKSTLFKGYMREDFEEAFTCYLSAAPSDDAPM